MASLTVGWAWQMRPISSAERREFHRHGGFGDHRAGFGADDVHAEHLVGGLVGQHLHEALGRAVGAAARIGGEGILADLVGDAGGLELLLGLADPGDLGLGVDDRGHEVPVHWPFWPAMVSTQATPSSLALCASIGPSITSPIA